MPCLYGLALQKVFVVGFMRKKKGFLLPVVSPVSCQQPFLGSPLLDFPGEQIVDVRGRKSLPIPLSAARTSTETTEHNAQ